MVLPNVTCYDRCSYSAISGELWITNYRMMFILQFDDATKVRLFMFMYMDLNN